MANSGLGQTVLRPTVDMDTPRLGEWRAVDMHTRCCGEWPTGLHAQRSAKWPIVDAVVRSLFECPESGDGHAELRRHGREWTGTTRAYGRQRTHGHAAPWAERVNSQHAHAALTGNDQADIDQTT